MPKWTERDLRGQYLRAKAAGWLPWFVEAADSVPDDGIGPDILLGIGSRETNVRNIKGDFRNGRYNGYSLMQLDIGSHRAWIESGAWRDVRKAIHKGAEALDEKRQQILDLTGQRAEYKGRAFKGTAHTAAQLVAISLAAYNSGLGAYYSWSVDGDPDKRTTGGDYGRDVLARAEVFRKWLEADGLMGAIAEPSVAVEPPAVESIAGGGAADPPVTANPVPLWQKITGWLAGAGVTFGGAQQLVSTTAGDAQAYLIGGLVVLAALVLLAFVVDHLMTKWFRSRPDRINVH